MRSSLVSAALALIALPFGAACGQTGSPIVENSKQLNDDVTEAKRFLSSVDTCRLEAIPRLVQFLRKYEGRREPELQSLAAEARYDGGSALRWRGHDKEAERWFDSVVRVYGRHQGLPFRRI